MSVGYQKSVRQPRKIRYTEAEWSLVVGRARATGRPPARYVREISLGANPKVRRGREHDDIIHELGRIGTTLTQLGSVTKENGFTSQNESIQAALAELLALVRRLA
ncbi:MAG: plasmid mobilization protein [Gemmatimonadales bacterium]